MFERLHVGTFQLQVAKFASCKLESCKLNNKLQRSAITMNNAVGQITYEVLTSFPLIPDKALHIVGPFDLS